MDLGTKIHREGYVKYIAEVSKQSDELNTRFLQSATKRSKAARIKISESAKILLKLQELFRTCKYVLSESSELIQK